jgi:F-type H+-transporting ATPase subunit delta
MLKPGRFPQRVAQPKSVGKRAFQGIQTAASRSRQQQSEGSFHVASEATGVSGLAERYAKALFELADDRKVLDDVATDLRALRGLIDESADFRRLIRSPVLSRVEQAKAVAALAQRLGFSALTRNFLGVVASNRRLFALPGVIAGYLKELGARRGEVTAEVTAAKPLTPAQTEAVSEQLRKVVGGKVAVDLRIDPSLIGGLVVKVGSRMVDASLKSKLARLQLAMKGV